MAPQVVEPLIALSIAYVAIENLVRPELDRRRLAFVFGCGLLHGLVGASTLAGLGLPRSGTVIALVSFDVGIDIALLAILAGAYLLVGWGHAAQSWYRSRILQPASTLLACTAIYLMISRLPL
jgi:HupE/UreJ protein